MLTGVRNRRGDREDRRCHDNYARSAAFERSRLTSRSCAAVKAEPQVPHRQLVKELAAEPGASWAEGSWFPRTARTNSPPQSEHFRFCIFGP